jgi:hypothetical protein
MSRNPHTSYEDERITITALENMENHISQFWEDTMLVTEPNKMKVIQVGNFRAIIRQLLEWERDNA